MRRPGPSGADLGLHALYSFQMPGNWVFSPFVAVPLALQTGTFGSITLELPRRPGCR